MREIKSGDIILRIRASSLAIFFFKQEFKTDILKEIGKIYSEWLGNAELMEAVMAQAPSDSDENEPAQNLGNDLIKANLTLFEGMPDGYKIMQIAWAMNKAQNVSESLQTPSFDKWVEKYQDLIVMDIYQDVIEESMNGFFRQAPKEQDPNQ